MKLIIQVTQEDIDKGIPGDECNCPIALALKRDPQIDPDTVCVDEGTVEYFSQGGDKFRGFAYYDMRRFITRFDKRESVEPEDFIIDVSKEIFDPIEL